MKKRKSYLSKQVVAAIVIATVLVVSIPLYFFVLKPFLLRNEEQVKVIPPMIQGEFRSKNGIHIFDLPEKDEQEYFIGKGDNVWSFYRIKDKGISVRGYELTPFKDYLLYVQNALKSPMISGRVFPTTEDLLKIRDEKVKKMTDEELEKAGGLSAVTVTLEELKNANLAVDYELYGFKDLKTLPYYYTTGSDDVTHKVYLGDYTPDGVNRYAMYEGRPCIYIVSAMVESAISSPIESYVNPILTVVPKKAAAGEYTPNKFIIHKNGKVHVNIQLFDPVVALQMDMATNSLLLKYIGEPGKEEDAELLKDYNIYNTSSNYTNLLYKYFRDALYGSEVVAMAGCDPVIKNGQLTYEQKDLSDEILKKYLISKDTPDMAFTFSAGKDKDKVDNMLVFSLLQKDEKTGEEFYYVYNALFETIVKMVPSVMPFLGEEEVYFRDSYISLIPITSLESVKIDSTMLNPTFAESLEITKLQETFRIKYEMNATGTDKVLDENGTPILKDVLFGNNVSVPDVSKKVTGIANFQRLYYELLMVRMYQNVDKELDNMAGVNLEKPDIVINYEVTGGRTHELKFYFYDPAGTLAFYTYDGKGRYVVWTEDVKSFINAIDYVRNGVSVNEKLGDPT